MAKVKRGRAHEIDVAPGSHTVRLTIDWCSSPEARVELRAGDRVALVCEPGGGTKPHDAIPSITVGRDFYIALELDG